MAQVQILYVATDSGLVQLANPGTSDRWRAVGSALEGEAVRAVRASATDPLLVFAGSAAGLYASQDGGASWEQQAAIDVTALAAAPDGSLYAGTTQGAILQGGPWEWNDVHSGPAPVAHLAVFSDGRLAAVYGNGTIEVLANGEWATLSMLVPGAAEIANSVADPAELYITTENSVVTRLGTRALDGRGTGAIVLLGGKPEVILVGTEGVAWRSEDGGATFQAIEGPTNVRVLVSPPRFLDFAYAGTARGELWLSRDRGRSWRKLHEGMAPANDLSFARVQ